MFTITPSTINAFNSYSSHPESFAKVGIWCNREVVLMNKQAWFYQKILWKVYELLGLIASDFATVDRIMKEIKNRSGEAQLTERPPTLTDLEQQIQEKQKTVGELTQSATTLSAENERLSAAIEAVKAEMENAQKELEAKQQLLSTVGKDLETKNSELQSLEVQIANSRENLLECETKIKESEKKLKENDERLQQMTSLNKQIDNKQAIILQKTQEINELQKLIAKQKSSSKEMREKITLLAESIGQYELREKKLSEKNLDAQAKCLEILQNQVKEQKSKLIELTRRQEILESAHLCTGARFKELQDGLVQFFTNHYDEKSSTHRLLPSLQELIVQLPEFVRGLATNTKMTDIPASDIFRALLAFTLAPANLEHLEELKATLRKNDEGLIKRFNNTSYSEQYSNFKEYLNLKCVALQVTDLVIKGTQPPKDENLDLTIEDGIDLSRDATVASKLVDERRQQLQQDGLLAQLCSQLLKPQNTNVQE